MRSLIITVALMLILAACGPQLEPPPTYAPPTETATVSPTPPPDAKFSIGTRVYLKSTSFSVPLAPGPYIPDGVRSASGVCFTNVLPTILSIVRQDGNTYYLVDCNGLSQGWLPEDAIDAEPGR